MWRIFDLQTYSIALQSPFSFHLGCSYARKKQKQKQKQQQQQKGLHFVSDDLLYAVSHVDAHMHAHDLPIIKAAPFILSICIMLWNLHMHLPLSNIWVQQCKSNDIGTPSKQGDYHTKDGHLQQW